MTGDLKASLKKINGPNLLVIVIWLLSVTVSICYYFDGRNSPHIGDVGWFDPFSGYLYAQGIPLVALAWPGFISGFFWWVLYVYGKRRWWAYSFALLLYILALGLNNNVGGLEPPFRYFSLGKNALLLNVAVILEWLLLVAVWLWVFVSALHERKWIPIGLLVLCIAYIFWVTQIFIGE